MSAARSIRQEVMQLPEMERLPYALDRLAELLGEDQRLVAGVRLKYGLTVQEARTLIVLAQAAPRPVSAAALLDAIGSAAEDPYSLFNTVSSKLRRRGFEVVAKTPIGYALARPIVFDLPPDPAPQVVRLPSPRPGMVRARRLAVWTQEEEAELLRMVADGWETCAIAEELDRTERAVTDRICLLRRRVGP